MLPSKIFCLKTFPLNSNNKIDRINLKTEFKMLALTLIINSSKYTIN